ncbi:MAG: hypothetical protein ABFC24_03500 [Methanoregulaceae archaeon]
MKPKFEKKTPTNWKKIGAILLCVIVAVAMIVSTLGYSWITSLAGIKSGESVLIDFTLKDAQGRPVLTSNQQVFTDAARNGYAVYYSKQIELLANTTTTEDVTSLPVYVLNEGWTGKYALFADEYNTMSQGVVGMKKGETKTLAVPDEENLVQQIPASRFALMNMSVSSLKTGDQLQMGVTTLENGTALNSTDQISSRIGSVLAVTNDSVVLDSGVHSISLTVVSTGTS